jgi:hypothetical protein
VAQISGILVKTRETSITRCRLPRRPPGTASIFDLTQSGERDLVQIVYVSGAPAQMTEDEIESLATRARERSRSARLTGLLVRHGAYYYAVLEGPRRRVFQRVEEIISEQGQRGVRILREETIRARRFANWTYSVIPASDADTGAPSHFLWRYCGLDR